MRCYRVALGIEDESRRRLVSTARRLLGFTRPGYSYRDSGDIVIVYLVEDGRRARIAIARRGCVWVAVDAVVCLSASNSQQKGKKEMKDNDVVNESGHARLAPSA